MAIGTVARCPSILGQILQVHKMGHNFGSRLRFPLTAFRLILLDFLDLEFISFSFFAISSNIDYAI